MLTPKQLKSYDFQSVGRNAYKSTDVDEFMSEVYESYEQMFRENGELVKKLSLLAEKVSEYKSDSDNIRNALLTAERMKERIVNEAEDFAKQTKDETETKVKSLLDDAQDKSKNIIEKANDNADKIVLDAKYEADKIMNSTKEKSSELLSKSKELYDTKMNALKADSIKQQAILDNLKNNANDLKSKLKELYTCHLELVDDMPDFQVEKSSATYSEEYLDSKSSGKSVKSINDYLDESKDDDMDFSISENDDEITENINSYVENDIDEDVKQYVPLEYISDEEGDNNDKDIVAKDSQTNKAEDYESDDFEGYDEEEDDEEEENIDELNVDIDSLYSDDDDDDVSELKSFFKEKETQEY